MTISKAVRRTAGRFALYFLGFIAAAAAVWQGVDRGLDVDPAAWLRGLVSQANMPVARNASSAGAISAAAVPPAYSLTQSWSNPGSVGAVAVGDFNGDGKDDLATFQAANVGQYELSEVHVFLQLPNGTMGPPTVYSPPMDVPNGFVLGMTSADLNEDGRDDLVFANSRVPGLNYLLSQAGGGYQWRFDDWSMLRPDDRAHAADMDGDGHVDIVSHLTYKDTDAISSYAGVLATYFGDGNGNFNRHGFELTRDDVVASALGQLNNDSRPDFLSLRANNVGHATRLRRNDGAGGWLPAQSIAIDIAETYMAVGAADVTGGARTDTIALTRGPSNYKFVVYPQLANGDLAAQPVKFPAIGSSTLLRHADLDGDGDDDLLHGNVSSEAIFNFYLQDEYGLGYGRAASIDLGGNNQQFLMQDLATGDFNGDGITDVAVATSFHGVIIMRGVLTPFAGAGALPGAPGTPVAVEMGGETANVTVSPPADSGGNPITGYSVYSVPSGGKDWHVGTLEGVHLISGLDKGKSYSFYARASTVAGMGPASALSNSVAIGTPVDPNSPPVLRAFFNYYIFEGDIGTGTASVQLWLSKPAPAGGVHFDWATGDGTAKAGLDYVAGGQTGVTIAAGEIYGGYVELNIIGDMAVEGDEDLHFILSNPQGATIEEADIVSTIYDNDTDEPRLAMSGASVVEGNSGTKVVNLELRLSKALPTPVTFDVESSDYYTVVDVDYNRVNLVGLQIPAGQTSLTVPVTIRGDTVFEEDEFFEVYPINLQGAAYAQLNGYVHILNDDPLPTLSIADVSVVEGDQGRNVARLRARLSAALPYDIGFSAYSADASASAGSDYVSRFHGGMVMKAGETWHDFEFDLVPDTRFESDESFLVRLADTAGVAVPDDSASVTLLNDDVPNGISVDDTTVAEGGAARFAIRLSQPAAQPVHFNAWTSQGTAFEGLDFQSTHATDLIIPAGASAVFFDVPTLADTEVEDNETFVLNIGNVSGATLRDAQGLAKIINDDLATLSVGDASVVEGNDQLTYMYFEVRLSKPLPTRVSFSAEFVAGGSAEPAMDFSLPPTGPIFIDAGRVRATFRVPVYSDTVSEPDETILVKLVKVKGALPGDDVGQGTIVNDDGAGVARNAPYRLRTYWIPPKVAGWSECEAGAKAKDDSCRKRAGR